VSLGCTTGFLAQMRRRRERGEEEAYDRVRADFEAINRTLRQLGLPPHHEPEDVPDFSFDLGLPNCLHGLRRLAAYSDRDGGLPPERASMPWNDPLLEAYRSCARDEPGRFEHLIMHSDCGGYYLPLDFPRVIYDADGLPAHCRMIGSVRRLLAECEEIAAALRLPRRKRPQAILDHCDRIGWPAGSGAPWERFGAEAYACAQLIRAARRSIELCSAIWFD
jgi:hypothetical protein